MSPLLLLAAVALATLAGVLIARQMAARRTARVLVQPPGDLWHALGEVPDGRPAVLTFSTPSCGECRVQESIAGPLAGAGVRLLRVDASAEPGVAGMFGVLSVPSSVVLAGDGRPLAVNHGLAQLRRLESQLELAG